MTSRRLLLAILGVCLLSRVGAVLVEADADPRAAIEADTRSYVRPALALLDNGEFSQTRRHDRPEFFRTPGYPGFIAVVFGIFGKSRTALLLAQVLVSTLTALVVYLLGARMWSIPVGLLAAALTTLDPLQLYSVETIMSENLATLLLVLVAGVGFFVFSRQKPKLRWLALLGLAMATATMVRPVTYYLPLLVILLLAYRFLRRETPWRSAVQMLVAFLVPVVVVIGGWQLRNHEQVDSWRFSAVEAQNLYLYRAAGIVSDEKGISLAAAKHREIARFGDISSHETQGAFYGRMYRRGFHVVASEPIEAAEGVAKGLLAELTSIRGKAFLGLRPESGALEYGAAALLLAFYGVSLYGVTLVVRARRDLVAHLFVLGVAAYILLVSAGPEAEGGRGERFRAVIMPVLILYAARGARELYARSRTRASLGETATTGLPG